TLRLGVQADPRFHKSDKPKAFFTEELLEGVTGLYGVRPSVEFVQIATLTFYQDVLGLELIMDLGWIRTYGSSAKMTIQVSVASEGGSGTDVPDISIEVDDLEEALRRVQKAGFPIEYGPKSEPWGVRRFYVRDPFGKLISILQHEVSGTQKSTSTRG